MMTVLTAMTMSMLVLSLFLMGVFVVVVGVVVVVIVAVARTAGWIAHWKEMYLDPLNKLNRPRQLYIGKNKREFVELIKR